MSKTESWKNWLPVIIALIAFGLFAALWPSLSSGLGISFGGGSSTRIPYEPQPIVLEIPEMTLPVLGTVGGQTITMEPWQAVLGVTAVTVALVASTGVILGFLYVFLSKLSTRPPKEFDSQNSFLSPIYKLLSRIVNFFRERANRKFAGRTVHPIPPHEMPRWSLISTALITLTFVLLGGMVLVTTFYPERVVEIGEELVNPGTLIVGIPLLITATLFVFAPRWGTAVLALLIMFFIAFATFGAVSLASTSFNWSLTLTNMISIVGLVQMVTLIILANRWHSTPAAEFNQKVAQTDASGRQKGIPYDAIAVLITGMLIVGLGIGLMVLVNSPFWAQLTGQ